MNGDIVVLVICGVDNCVAFVDMISSFIWVIGSSVGIVISFLDDTLVISIITNFIDFKAVRGLGG